MYFLRTYGRTVDLEKTKVVKILTYTNTGH